MTLHIVVWRVQKVNYFDGFTKAGIYTIMWLNQFLVTHYYSIHMEGAELNGFALSVLWNTEISFAKYM